MDERRLRLAWFLMARSHGRVKVEIWRDRDWRALSLPAQWTYMMLISQPTINNCGVIPFVPRRWMSYTATDDDIGAALDELVTAAYIVVDDDTQEVLVRTFIHHDRIERQPNLVKAARTEYDRIESDRLRHVLADQYPHLFDARGQKGLFPTEIDDLPEPLPEGDPKDLPEGVGDRVRVPARSRARTAPAPSPTPEGNASSVATQKALRDDSNSATPPAASQAPPAVARDEAFAAANRFVVTSGGWRDPRLDQTLRREWPELGDDDVGLLVSTANEMALREVSDGT